MTTTTLISFATFLTLAALPAPASAGTVALDGHRLQVTTSAAANELVIGRVANRIRVEEHISKAGLTTPQTTCDRRVEDDVPVVECPAKGVREIVVSTRGGNDWVVLGQDQPESRHDRNHCSFSKVGAALVVDLGTGNDVAELGAGNDHVRGGRGRDLLMACAGDDLVVGGPQADQVSGDRGNDLLRGGSGPDGVFGCRYDPDDVNYPLDETGADDLDGGTGGDFLYGCNGLDTYSAGDAKDHLNLRDGVGEVADCGEGNDVIYLDPEDSHPGCEIVTDCETDNYPIGPGTGVPDCFAGRPR